MTLLNRDTVVVGTAPRISPATFETVLKDAGSPATGEAQAMFDAIAAEGIDPAFMLAIFKKESAYATDPKSMVVRHDTKNLGNTRSSRIGVKTIIPTERGNFVKYDSWGLGARDAAFRLSDPTFDYARAGAKTIGEIIPIWAPASDSNSPEAYIAAVVESMNQWIGEGESSNMVAKPNITWIGSPNFWPDRDGHNVIAIVNHIMQGSLESTDGWFNNPASQVSAHFGVGKDGRIHQYVPLEGAAWANGVAEHLDPSIPWLVDAVKTSVNPNNLTVSIEHEGDTGDTMPEAQYQATLALHKWLISLYSAVKADRQHIVGHYQISGTIKINCPGKGFLWGRLMQDLTGLDAAGQVPYDPFGKYVADNGGEAVFGKPTSGMYGSTPGSQEQDYEYAHLFISGGKVVAEMKDRNNPQGFDVGVGILAKAKELGLIMLTNGQFFIPSQDKPQPGLGKMERAWAQDSKGVTLVIMASEQPELAKPGQDTPWKVEVLEVK